MFKQRNNNPLFIDSYGTRLGRDKEFNRPSSIMESNIVCYLFIALFALADYCCLSISWNTVQTSSPGVITLLALSCAVCLDVPMAIAGVAFKSYRQGLKSKKDMLIILSLSIAVFALVFIFSFLFKIETRTASFEEANSAGGLVNSLAAQTNPEDSKSILIAALFSAVLPLATSIASFVIALRSSNPKKTKLNRLERKKKKIEGHLVDIEQTLVEEENIKKNAVTLIERERDLFRQFVEEVIMVEGIRIQAANQALQEHINNPDAVSLLSEYGTEVDKEYTGLEYEDCAKNFAEDFMDNYNPIGVVFGDYSKVSDVDLSGSPTNSSSTRTEDDSKTNIEHYSVSTKGMLEAG